MVEYVKSNFSFTVNNEQITLKKGGIKLGSHQTDLKFVLPPFSREIEKFDIHIPAFKENDYHQTIFSYNVFGKTDKVILDVKNEYQSTIKLNGQAKTTNSFWSFFYGLSFLASLVFLFFR